MDRFIMKEVKLYRLKYTNRNLPPLFFTKKRYRRKMIRIMKKVTDIK